MFVLKTVASVGSAGFGGVAAVGVAETGSQYIVGIVGRRGKRVTAAGLLMGCSAGRAGWIRVGTLLLLSMLPIRRIGVGRARRW